MLPGLTPARYRVAGVASATAIGASLVPVMVMVREVDEVAPLASATV